MEARRKRNRRNKDGLHEHLMEKQLKADGTPKSERELQLEKDHDEHLQHEAIVKLFEKKKGYNNRLGSMR